MEKIIECGCCGCYHFASFNGDCRDDANRFPTDDPNELIEDRLALLQRAIKDRKNMRWQFTAISVLDVLKRLLSS